MIYIRKDVFRLGLDLNQIVLVRIQGSRNNVWWRVAEVVAYHRYKPLVYVNIKDTTTYLAVGLYDIATKPFEPRFRLSPLYNGKRYVQVPLRIVVPPTRIKKCGYILRRKTDVLAAGDIDATIKQGLKDILRNLPPGHRLTVTHHIP